jgi:hypothetical protein
MVAILNITGEKVKRAAAPVPPEGWASTMAVAVKGGNDVRATAADAPIDGVVVIV